MNARLLFVCTGNTWRSPIAAALGRERGVEAESAGVAAQRGDRAAPNASRALRAARGLDLHDHTPCSVTDVSLANVDRIVAMDPDVARRLRAEHEIESDALITWAISDPYGGSLADYRRCVEQIDLALEDLLSTLT